MPSSTKPRDRKPRDTALAIVDKSAPAYRVIYGAFGGLTPFVRMAREAGCPVAKSTAHMWVVSGLIPSRRQGNVLAIARHHGVKLDPALLVPRPAQAEAA